MLIDVTDSNVGVVNGCVAAFRGRQVPQTEELIEPFYSLACMLAGFRFMTLRIGQNHTVLRDSSGKNQGAVARLAGLKDHIDKLTGLNQTRVRLGGIAQIRFRGHALDACHPHVSRSDLLRKIEVTMGRGAQPLQVIERH